MPKKGSRMPRWEDYELGAMRVLYPRGDWKLLLQLLKHRTYISIRSKASRMGLVQTSAVRSSINKKNRRRKLRKKS